MKRYMDNLVEEMDDYVSFIGETTTELAGYLGKLFVLLTFPIWYLLYKFFRRR